MKTNPKHVQLLYSSGEVHAAIKKIFSAPSVNDRRVALVAYVGSDAESYLPHPEHLHIICSPSAGGTDPDTIRSLIQRKARVQFSDGLHMKVYWSRLRGCVITSANASTSALGRTGLKEAGIWLPPGSVSVDRLVKYADARDVSQKEIRLLDEKTKDRRKLDLPPKRKQQDKDFLQWISSPHPSKWKLGWWDEYVRGNAQAASEATMAEYGQKEPHTWSPCSKKCVKKHDWILCFMFTPPRGIACVQWMFVDFLVKISPREKRYYDKDWPYHAIQVHPLSRYPLPPFKITPAFRSALRHAINRFGRDRIKDAKSDTPSRRLLNLISEEMKEVRSRG